MNYISKYAIALKKHKQKTSFCKNGKKTPYPIKLCGSLSLIIVY